MEEQLYSVLSGLGYTTSWGGLGQGTALPRIALYRVSGLDAVTLQGRSGFVEGRVQADIYGKTYQQAVTASRAVTAAVSGYRGGPIWHAQVVNIRDRPEEGGGDVIQRVSLDIAVLYRE
ncbi:hypothetical protein [Jannaschia formosa]|uniref:hypothetical protein n=1 Tax=Jannaschia formosa TaxID=2259592 RepID=UPI000E1C1EAB|nr:hypothetical protein [Jannaschia formosa]TFL16436.1 hypothetical protein DR046_20155 [Jannaschia formosa]